MTDIDPRIPPIGTVSQAERMLRTNWVAALERSPSGSPLVWPEFVAVQGRSVRIIDVREADELVGPLGHIPGADWIPKDRVPSLVERLGPDAKVILVSRAGERSAPLAKELEHAGMPFVASMIGGMVSWKYLGFQTVRDPSILARRDVLRDAPTLTKADKPLSLDAITAHIDETSSVRWMKLAALLLHGRLSCVDGRDETGVIGTPGGDSGELLLALAAVERITGTKLSTLAIREIFARRLDVLGRFYLHTDIHASNELIKAIRGDKRFDSAIRGISEGIQWRAFLTAPPVHLREALLEHMVAPGHVGCGHLRLSMTAAEAYGARPELVKTVLQAFFRARWGGAVDAEYTVLPGAHDEGAVVRVYVEESSLRPFTPIPLVSPTAGGLQMFVAHPQVADHLRQELAHFLVRQGDTLDLSASHFEPLLAEMRALGDVQLGATLGRLAKGLPIYDVWFGPHGAHRVEHAGEVG
ncbi:MAG: rhodanese-like domain-containing protein [Sandaracinus sp.]